MTEGFEVLVQLVIAAITTRAVVQLDRPAPSMTTGQVTGGMIVHRGGGCWPPPSFIQRE